VLKSVWLAPDEIAAGAPSSRHISQIVPAFRESRSTRLTAFQLLKRALEL
jgi:hypothetical protein